MRNGLPFWAVMIERRDTGRVRIFKRCRSRSEAAAEALDCNRSYRGDAPVLFYAEYWQTSSVLDVEHAR